MVMNMSKAPENTGSNYVIFPSVLATGAGFVHSRCYKNFLPSLRLALPFLVWNGLECVISILNKGCKHLLLSCLLWKKQFPSSEVKFSLFSINIGKHYVSILCCIGLLYFVISLVKIKSSLFKCVYSMHSYNLNLVFFIVIEVMVQ